MRLTVCRCEPGPMFSQLLKKSRAKPIDRDRKAIKSARFKLRKTVRAFIKEEAPAIIAHVVAEVAKLRKAAGDEDGDNDLLRVLDGITLNWSALTPDVTPHIESILQDSGAQALVQIDASTETNVNLVNEKAVAYAKERAAVLVTNISESTRGMLRTDVATAMQEGWSNDKLSATLEDNYAFSSARSDMIARTETAYADVQGNLDAYKVSGVVESKEWITGAGCCDLCDELDGETIPLDDTFATEDGAIQGPPLHPSCRCDLLPITKDAESEE